MFDTRMGWCSIIVLLSLVTVSLATEKGWIDQYFRVPHAVHFKMNFNCKNKTMCEKPIEDAAYLATLQWPKSIREYVACMTWECACPAYNGIVENGICRLPDGRGTVTKAVRKEYRQLTANERNAYVETLKAMQRDGTYRQIGIIHRAAGVHSGPSFFPWHREFLKRTEFILRLYNPTLVMPYWDSTLESHLPQPADSIMFSKYLYGNVDKNGDVYDTPFVNFTTMDGRPTYNRQFGKQTDGEMINEPRIDWILNQTDIRRVLAYSMPLMGCKNYELDDRFLEYTHDYVHYFLNGDFEDRTTSSNDPLFFLHHAFIDYIWEMWRQKQQTKEQREVDYPADEIECMPPWHFKNSRIPLLGGWKNVDGLSNKYADDLSVYALRPTCTKTTEECESEFLFCDTQTTPMMPHCVSKVKQNGNCTGFEWSPEICYEGECIDGRCSIGNVESANFNEWHPSQQPMMPPPQFDEFAVKIPKFRPQRPLQQFEAPNIIEVTPNKISRFM